MVCWKVTGSWKSAASFISHKIPGFFLRRKWQLTPVFLPGKISWSLAGYSPWGHKESDTTERPNNLVFNWAGPEAKCAQANASVWTPPRNLPCPPPHVLSLHSRFRQLGHLIMSLLCLPQSAPPSFLVWLIVTVFWWAPGVCPACLSRLSFTITLSGKSSVSILLKLASSLAGP